MFGEPQDSIGVLGNRSDMYATVVSNGKNQENQFYSQRVIFRCLGPFLGQDPVELFHFVVGLSPVGPGTDVEFLDRRSR